MSQDELKDQQMRNNRLTFGLKFWSTYKKHDTQEVNGIMWNSN